MKPSRIATSIQPTQIRAITQRARSTSLHLGLGQPDLPLAPWVTAELAAVGEAPYTANRGAPEAVNAVRSRYDDDVGVIVTVGAQQALALGVLGLVEPGSDVLVPDPGFPAYPNLVRAAGANPIPYALGDDHGLDAALVERAWTSDTVAIVLNSPSNPTGAVSGAEATRDVVTLSRDRGAFWISDEIYEDLVWVGEHVSPRRFGDNGVIVSGLSKSHAAMGLRIGWLAGPPATLDALVPLHQHLVACAPVSSQRATTTMIRHHDEQVANIRAELSARRSLMQAALQTWDVPQVSLDGAFYAWVDVRAALEPGQTSLQLALQILDEVDVVTIGGGGFGEGGEGFLRLAYTVQTSILSEALGRVGEFLQSRIRSLG